MADSKDTFSHRPIRRLPQLQASGMASPTSTHANYVKRVGSAILGDIATPPPPPPTAACALNRNRKTCAHNGCTSKADQRGLCVKHGGRGKCLTPGCTTNAVGRRGLCTRHGGNGTCSSKGCSSNVYSRGLCKKHGGLKMTKCTHPSGCISNAVARGRCSKHGGKSVCKTPGCTTNVQARGLCTKHGGNGFCSVMGCSEHVRARGLCVQHDTKRGIAQCLRTGCTALDYAQHGLCPVHSPPTCSSVHCAETAAAWGLCRTHVAAQLVKLQAAYQLPYQNVFAPGASANPLLIE